jgi:MraZ protein
MNYFNDKYLHSIDGKGRLLLPLEIRDYFKMKKGDSLYLIPNTSEPSYLEIRTAEQWKSYCNALMQQEPSKQKKDFLRYTRISLECVKLDAHGRIMIPQRLRDLCMLNGTVAIINMDLFVEVWSRENMEAKYHEMVKAFRELHDLTF